MTYYADNQTYPSQHVPDNSVVFSKTNSQFGWLSNMSGYQIEFQGQRWASAEALFQTYRFADPTIREAIRRERNPIRAKGVAKAHIVEATIEPRSDIDVSNMRWVLGLKLDQHPHLRDNLRLLRGRMIVEDVSNRQTTSGLFWGMAKSITYAHTWYGHNTLGKLWMELCKTVQTAECSPSAQLVAALQAICTVDLPSATDLNLLVARVIADDPYWRLVSITTSKSHNTINIVSAGASRPAVFRVTPDGCTLDHYQISDA